MFSIPSETEIEQENCSWRSYIFDFIFVRKFTLQKISYFIIYKRINWCQKGVDCLSFVSKTDEKKKWNFTWWYFLTDLC